MPGTRGNAIGGPVCIRWISAGMLALRYIGKGKHMWPCLMEDQGTQLIHPFWKWQPEAKSEIKVKQHLKSGAQMYVFDWGEMAVCVFDAFLPGYQRTPNNDCSLVQSRAQ